MFTDTLQKYFEILNSQFGSSEIFLNPFAKGLVNTYQIFLLDKRCSMRFCMVYQKNQMYSYCIHLFMSLFIIPAQSIIGKILPNLWQKRLQKKLYCVYQVSGD